MGSYNCPAQNNTSYSSSLDITSTYTIICDADQPGGAPGIDGSEVQDLNTGVVATSIEGCIDACVGNALGGGGCAAVTYDLNITKALSRGGVTGNCFLKDQRAEELLSYGVGVAVSAYLDVSIR